MAMTTMTAAASDTMGRIIENLRRLLILSHPRIVRRHTALGGFAPPGGSIRTPRHQVARNRKRQR
jgi:hypothetical protein